MVTVLTSWTFCLYCKIKIAKMRDAFHKDSLYMTIRKFIFSHRCTWTLLFEFLCFIGIIVIGSWKKDVHLIKSSTYVHPLFVFKVLVTFLSTLTILYNDFNKPFIFNQRSV